MLLQTPSPVASSSLSRTSRLGRTFALAGMVAMGAMACDKVPLTAPIGTVITLVASTNVVPINGSVNIVAVLIETDGDAGTPVHNGTVVNFTTSLGRIEPSEARTVNGRASVSLVSDGRSGTATITAFSGSATKTLELKIGAAAAERVSVTASPSSVQPNGGTTTISARVEDLTGNPVANIPVTFTTTTGSLSSQSVLTNEVGIATTFLSTTTNATVTASSGGKTSTVAVTVRSRSSVTLAPPTGSIFVGAAASFTVTPGATVPLKDVRITYGDGASQQLGAITGPTVVQHVYDDDGVFQVEVVGTDVDGGTAIAIGSVTVVPITFTVSASASSAPVNTTFLFKVEGLPATVPIEKYVWNFGDGNVQTTTSASITHAYQIAGLKTVTVTVHPVNGDARSATLQVVVTGPFF